eukprot:Hpha_TRINITY_DN1594_c0_g1::TRINITY_DN1594_c0_g1_i1::g.57146::m.57146/K01136/IDS; iduronate 2-sulfatase
MAMGCVLFFLAVSVSAVPTCDHKLFMNRTCEPRGAYDKATKVNECACQALCNADSRCDHWVFQTTNVSLNCHLKDVPVNASDLQEGKCTVGPNSRGPTPAPQPAPPGAKNILYVIVDDLRNELGFTNKNPHIISPNLDALAAAGTVFDRAYVQQGVCSPSRNSCLSGRRPDTTKIWNFKGSFRDTLGAGVNSFPEAFKRNGYMVAGMGKVYHPGHPAKDDYPASWSEDWPYFQPKNFSSKTAALPDSSFQDGQITDAGVERLGDFRAKIDAAVAAGQTPKPFFLAVGLHKPHIPWVMPQRFLDMQTPENETDTAAHDTAPQNACNVSMYECYNLNAGGQKVNPYVPFAKDVQQDRRRQYRGATSWTDYNVGRLLAALDKHSFTADTAVIFHGDHGWLLGEHGGYCKQNNFELVARVPLIVKVPWLPATHGVRSQALVEIVDLYPTALDLMGLAHAAAVPDFAQLEGTSFAPLLTSHFAERLGGGSAWKNATFTQYPRCKSDDKGAPPQTEPWISPTDNACTGVEDSNFDAMGYSIRSDRWRYTLWVKWDGVKLAPLWNEIVGEELYDHEGDDGMDTDGFENVNLVDDAHADVRAQMRASLFAGWKASRPAA